MNPTDTEDPADEAVTELGAAKVAAAADAVPPPDAVQYANEATVRDRHKATLVAATAP